MPTVSVAIPTYNRKDDLLVAIESAIKQSRVPDEIVVVVTFPGLVFTNNVITAAGSTNARPPNRCR